VCTSVVWDRCGIQKLLEQDRAVHVQDRIFAGDTPRATHTSFVTKQIPVLFFFFGFAFGLPQAFRHLGKNQAPSAAHLLDFIDDVALKIDSSSERTAFVTLVEDQSADHATSGGGSGYGPYFGSIPDFGQEVDGVKFLRRAGQDHRRSKAGFKAGYSRSIRRARRSRIIRFHDALRRSKIATTSK